MEIAFFFLSFVLMTNSNIIQWNVRGIHSRYEELQLICKQIKPSIVAIQENLV